MFGANKVTKPNFEETGHLKVNSIFRTIQGEGPFQGEPAIFVRLQGCNLRCRWCDTEFEKGQLYSIDELLSKLDSVGVITLDKRPLVVVTGGEPFLQADLSRFCDLLVAAGYKVQIETAGTLWQKGFDNLFESLGFKKHVTIVCSPKTGTLNKTLAYWTDAYKYVLRLDVVSKFDGLPTEIASTGKIGEVARWHQYSSYLYTGPKIYVMPCDEHDEELNRLTTEMTKEVAQRYGYRICLQLHKLLDVE